jgi:hypothetical protein
MNDIWSHELLKNKIAAASLVIVSLVNVIFSHDATILIVSLILGIPVFFSKENLIYEEYDD